MYTALVLDEKSQTFLRGAALGQLPDGWVTLSKEEPGLCHHMTVCMGEPKVGMDIRVGAPAYVVVNSFAMDDKVMAVGCEAHYVDDNAEVPSTNVHKHITLAIKYSEDGSRRVGKPFQSNQLTNWNPRTEMKLTGKVEVLQ